MIGAIAGDIIGSTHEYTETNTKDFPLFDEECEFTDDTVLTIAVADQLLNGGELVDLFHQYFNSYPNAGYGDSFYNWAKSKKTQPYNSWGNGSAMRVSPIGFAYNTLEEVVYHARKSAEVTHNHPEGVKEAQATATAIFLAKNNWEKTDIKNHLSEHFGYRLSDRLSDIRKHYCFDESCQGSVPQSIISFLKSDSYEDAIRNAISLGGDADTMACIAGGIAEAYYGGIPKDIATKSMSFLTAPLKTIVLEFGYKYGKK
jgi:ADP-ribosylglycohydrolase